MNGLANFSAVKPTCGRPMGSFCQGIDERGNNIKAIHLREFCYKVYVNAARAPPQRPYSFWFVRAHTAHPRT